MKILKIALLLFFIFNPLSANSKFCIQVTAAHGFTPNNMKPAVARILNNFDKARIDKRGGDLVLRVGDYSKYSYALKDLKDIQKMYSDAYIRRCNYIPSEAIYPKNLKQTSLPRKLQSQILAKKVELPKKEKKRKRKLVIINGKVQIIDESNHQILETKRVLRVQRVPKYKAIKHSKKKQESFIYNKDNKYNNDFYKECKRCYASTSYKPISKHQEKQHPVKKIKYPKKKKEIDKQNEGWLDEIFDKEKKSPQIEKKRIHYTYIDDKPKQNSDIKKDRYYNKVLQEKKTVLKETPTVIQEDLYIPVINEEIMIEEDLNQEENIDVEDIAIEMGEDIFSDNEPTEDIYSSNNRKKSSKKKKESTKEDENSFFNMFSSKKKEENDDDIDMNVDNLEIEDIDINTDDIDTNINIDDIQSPKDEHIKEEKGFFDFLKKPMKQEKEYQKKSQKKPLVEKNFYNNSDEYEEINLDNYQPSTPKKSVKQNTKKMLDDLYSEYEPIDTYNITPPEKKKHKKKTYDLMDQYESDTYIEKPIKKVKQSFQDEYKNQYVFQKDTNKQVPQQAYFNQDVMDEIATEKTDEDLYKNQYIFEKAKNIKNDNFKNDVIEQPYFTKKIIKNTPKNIIEKAKQEAEDLSYKNQYMYQHQDTPQTDENQYFDDTDEEELYKNQYMYQNHDDNGDTEQRFFIKEEKKDAPQYQYQHSSQKKEAVEIDDDY